MSYGANGESLIFLNIFFIERRIFIKEEWKKVKGYEGYYEISNLGHLRSVDRYVIRKDGVRHFCKGKLISQNLNTDGYPQAKLCMNAQNTAVRIHRLVAEHFVPNPFNYQEVNHIDCDRSNNVYTNLQWCTHIENVQHSAKKGHYKRYGSKNSNYRNVTLKEYYKNNPEEKKKLARPGRTNGRATPIRMIVPDKNISFDFSYIGQCAKFLKSNGYVSQNVSINSIRNNITLSIKNHKKYHGLLFQHI